MKTHEVHGWSVHKPQYKCTCTYDEPESDTATAVALNDNGNGDGNSDQLLRWQMTVKWEKTDNNCNSLIISCFIRAIYAQTICFKWWQIVFKWKTLEYRMCVHVLSHRPAWLTKFSYIFYFVPFSSCALYYELVVWLKVCRLLSLSLSCRWFGCVFVHAMHIKTFVFIGNDERKLFK